MNLITLKHSKHTWACTLLFSTRTLIFHLRQKFASPWLSLLDMLYTAFANPNCIQGKLFPIPSLHYAKIVHLCWHIMKALPWSEDSDLNLIHLAGLGGLKHPSDEVLNVVITLWKVLCRIEQDNRLMRQFLAGTSKTILIQLSISRLEFENFDFWRFEYHSCQTPFIVISTKYYLQLAVVYWRIKFAI